MRPEVQPQKEASAHQAKDGSEIEEHRDHLFTTRKILALKSHSHFFAFSPNSQELPAIRSRKIVD